MTSDDLGTMLEEDVAIEAAHEEAERESDCSAVFFLKVASMARTCTTELLSKARLLIGMCLACITRA